MRGATFAIVCLLFCTICYAASSTTTTGGGVANNHFYAMGSLFADANCSTQPIMHSFIILNYCFPEDGKYQIIIPDTVHNIANVMYYNTSDCSGKPIGNDTQALGSCEVNSDSGGYIFFNVTGLAMPEMAERVPTVSKDKYFHCTGDDAPIVERQVNDPKGCRYDDEHHVYVRLAGCNATSIFVWTYTNDSTCSGKPNYISTRPFDNPEGTCAVNNQFGDLDGTVNRCLYIPDYNDNGNGGNNGGSTYNPTGYGSPTGYGNPTGGGNGNQTGSGIPTGGASTTGGKAPNNDVNYGMQIKFLNPNCSGDPVGYNFVRLFNCNPADNNIFEQVTPTSQSQVTVNQYNTSDCSGPPFNSYGSPLGVCVPDPKQQGVFMKIDPIVYTSPEPPIGKLAYTIDNYQSCEGPITYRFVYNPTGCVLDGSGNYSRFSSCNSTNYEQFIYSNSQCSGEPTRHISPPLVLSGGCFSNPNTKGGYKHICLAPGGNGNGNTTGKPPGPTSSFGTTKGPGNSNGGGSTTGGMPNALYGMQSMFLNPNCSGEPAGYNFVRLLTCNPSDGDTFQLITVNSTQATIQVYNTSDCSGKPINFQTVQLGVCGPDPDDAGVFVLIAPSPVSSPNPPISQGGALSIDKYRSCNDQLTYRFVYNPRGCAPDDDSNNFVRFVNCNGTTVSQLVYNNSMCSGEPFMRNVEQLPQPEGCFENPNEDGGKKFTCVGPNTGGSTGGKPPMSTTGFGTTQGATLTGPVTTGTPNGPFQYGVGKSYRTSDCSGDFVMAGFVIINYCTPTDSGDDRFGSEFVTINGTLATAWKYDTPDCSGPAVDADYTQLGVCSSDDGDKGMFMKYEASTVTNIDVTTQNAPVFTSYATDSCGGPILQRFVYNPTVCMSGGGDGDDYPGDDYSVRYSTCNATAYTVDYFTGNGCARGNITQSFSYPLGTCGNGTRITCSGSGNAASSSTSGIKGATSTTGSAAQTSSTGGVAPTEKPKVVATIKLTISATFENISKVDVTALTSSFAASLGVDPSAVTVEFILVNDTRRVAKYQMVITVKAVVDAGTNATQLSTAAAATVTNTLSDTSSPLSTALSTAGATVTSTPQATAVVSTTVVTTSTTSSAATTTTKATTSGPALGTTTNKESGATRVAATALLAIVAVLLL